MTDEEKRRIIEEFTIITAKATLELFYNLGLKTHIESIIINDKNGDEFIFSFKKVENNVGLGSVSNSVCKHEDKHIESIMGEGVLCNKCNTVIKN